MSSIKKSLKQFKVLITSGPTREYIDPIRFISNSSSGQMGYFLAKTILKDRAKVTVISGPAQIKPPKKHLGRGWAGRLKETYLLFLLNFYILGDFL